MLYPSFSLIVSAPDSICRKKPRNWLYRCLGLDELARTLIMPCEASDAFASSCLAAGCSLGWAYTGCGYCIIIGCGIIYGIIQGWAIGMCTFC